MAGFAVSEIPQHRRVSVVMGDWMGMLARWALEGVEPGRQVGAVVVEDPSAS